MLKAIFLLTLSLFTVKAIADDHLTAPVPVEFWGCNFNDGFDMEDLMNWYAKFNKEVDSFEDQSYSAYIMTPMFSSEMNRVDLRYCGFLGQLGFDG